MVDIYNIGDDLYDKGDYVNAIKCYELAGKEGYSSGYNDVGYMYRLGEGVEKSDKIAFEYFKRAIDIDLLPIALHNLAHQYKCGEGTEKNIDKAIEYYRLAIEKRYINSPYCLAGIYKEQKDYENAVKYYRIGMDLGDEDCEKELKKMLSSKRYLRSVIRNQEKMIKALNEKNEKMEKVILRMKDGNMIDLDSEEDK